MMIDKYNADIHHRRSVRLKDYDYSQSGAYFVTICTWSKKCILGTIIEGKMQINEYGEIAGKEWLKTKEVRHNVMLDYYVIMPNHVHGIIVLNGIVGATRWVAPKRAIHRIAPTLQSNSIGAIIGQFKSAVTKHINRINETPPVAVWQRNYYEHVIRDENELNRIREYIVNNPLQWANDENNPLNMKSYFSGRDN